MNITIQCKDIGEINAICGMELQVNLEDIDFTFIQDLPLKKIVSFTDNAKVIKAMLENDEDLLSEVLQKLDDDIVYEYLEKRGLIANKM